MAKPIKFTERIDIPVPKGTKARAGKAADARRYDSIAPYLRRIILDAIENDLQEAKREKER